RGGCSGHGGLRRAIGRQCAGTGFGSRGGCRRRYSLLNGTRGGLRMNRNDRAPADDGTGRAKELFAPAEQAQKLKMIAGELPEWTLNRRQLCDLELLMSGGFAPLEGFLNRADYEGVVREMRLASGALWPMPITLDVSREFAEGLSRGDRLALRDAEG